MVLPNLDFRESSDHIHPKRDLQKLQILRQPQYLRHVSPGWVADAIAVETVESAGHTPQIESLHSGCQFRACFEQGKKAGESIEANLVGAVCEGSVAVD